MKPRVFIGSSGEAKKFAFALQRNLEPDAEVTVWDQDVFRPGQFFLESLLQQLDNTDLGLFVFSPDDTTQMRGGEHATVRDNVLFEFGLFVGRLGRQRSLIIAARDTNLRLPSDLLGLNVIQFEPARADGNLKAAMGPASNDVRTLIEKMPSRALPTLPELQLSVLERKDLLSPTQQSVLRAVEKAGKSSQKELERAFPRMPAAELKYRLEQLHYLRLVVRTKGADKEVTFAPSPEYVEVRKATRGL